MAGRGSGEEVRIRSVSRLLEKKGHRVIPYFRSSFEIDKMRFGKVRAFFDGIYNGDSRRRMDKFLKDQKPDLVFIQNLFPLISPSILLSCRDANIPVVMRCPNYRLVCPNGLFLTKGKICERCSGGKEYWCVLRDCEDNILKSTGYALRSYVARKYRFFKDNVIIFMVLTEFARNILIENGFPPERIQVISGYVNGNDFKRIIPEEQGSYVGYVGRFSREKGIETLIRSAGLLPDIPFKMAGGYADYEELIKSAPGNVTFLGQLDKENLADFYSKARIIVVPSRCYEGLASVILESMLFKRAVICSRLGGLPEVVEHNNTGLLFQPDNANDLAEKILNLWNNSELCYQMGLKGRQKAEEKYSSDAFYNRLILAFESAINLHKSRSQRL